MEIAEGNYAKHNQLESIILNIWTCYDICKIWTKLVLRYFW